MPREFPFAVTAPVWLWLLLLAPAAWWVGRRGLAALGPGRRRWALALRLAVLACLALALADARVRWRPDETTVIFAIDRSESVGEAEGDRALALVNQALALKPSRDRAGVVVFGEEALVERAPTPALKRVERLDSSPGRGFTDLGKALRLSAGLFPEGGRRRLVLFTDGNENLGSAAAEAASCAAQGIAVDVVPMRAAARDEVLVDAVQAPDRVEKKKPFEVKVTVRSTFAGPGTLRLYKDREFLGQQEVRLNEGKNIFVFPQKEDDAGFHTYEAQIDSPRDTVRDNNLAGGFSLVAGEPKVLLVGATDETRWLLESLKLEGVPVEASQSAPANAAEAENFDAIYLCDVSAETMSGAQQRLLGAWAGDLGGGLGMIGGQQSFGLGGWNKTPVEAALPVEMEIKDKKNFPSLGMVLLIDKSGSMMGTLPGSDKTKLEIACEAAVAAVGQLTERDRVGVIGFDSAAKWDAPFQLAKDKAALAEAIRSLRPGGGTDPLPAFDEAIKALSAQPLQLRHVILLTDGMVQPGDYDGMSKRLAGIKATLTCIGVGDDTDKGFLSGLAKRNNGRFYFTNDAASVPRIFTKEAVIAQRSYLVEGTFRPVVAARNDVIKGITGFPELRGYVATEPKDRAETLFKTAKGDPLLATWRYKAGKGLAWTSDARDRWASAWVGWSDSKKFWAQATRWLMRDRRPGVLAPRVIVENGTGKVTVDAVTDKGEFVNFLELETTVLAPDFTTKKVKLRQTSAGRYEGDFEARATGTYLTTVSGDAPGALPATAGASVGYPPEYRATKPDMVLLDAIAHATGGLLDPVAAKVFRRDGPPPDEGAVELWWHLLWLALLLFVADIAVRRVTLDEEQMAQLAAVLGRFVPRAPRRAHATATATMAALDTLKARRAEIRRDVVAPPAAIHAAHTATARPAAELFSPPPGTPPSAPAPPQPAKPAPASPATDGGSYTSRLLEAKKKAREQANRDN